jgi:hypothetical protein
MKNLISYVFIFICFFSFSTGASQEEQKNKISKYFANQEWKLIKEKDQVKIFSMEAKGFDVIAFRSVGTLNAPIDQVMELLRRVEISTEWMPRLQEKYVIRDVSDYEAVTYSINDLPWPFTDREMVLNNRLVVHKQTNNMVVEIFSVEDEKAKRREKSIRAQVYLGQTWLKAISDKQTEVEVVILIDPKGKIPKWLVNLLQKNMPYKLLKGIERMASKSSFPVRDVYKKIIKDLYPAIYPKIIK